MCENTQIFYQYSIKWLTLLNGKNVKIQNLSRKIRASEGWKKNHQWRQLQYHHDTSEKTQWIQCSCTWQKFNRFIEAISYFQRGRVINSSFANSDELLFSQTISEWNDINIFFSSSFNSDSWRNGGIHCT